VNQDSQSGRKPVKQQAGVVPYRQAPDGGTEILLITARSHPESWIFPLGCVDRGETLEEAAARECREESGWDVEIEVVVGDLDLEKEHSVHRVTFFIGRVTKEVARWDRDRCRRWVRRSELIRSVPDKFAPIAEAAISKLP